MYLWGAQLEKLEGPVTPPGAELVVNGTFTGDTDWTKGAGWTIPATNAVATAATGTLVPAVALTPVVGKTYQITYTAAVTTNTCAVSFGGAAGGDIVAGTANKLYLTATTTGSLIFTPSTFTGTLDDVSVKEITLPANSTPGPYTATAGSTATIPAQSRHEANGLLLEGIGINYALQARDFTNASWVKTGGGGVAAVKDQTGIDEVANSASKLTASGANGTALQTLTLAAADYNFSVCAKRITGTGNVDLTDNNGANWATITLTSAWQCFAGITRNQANPVVGVRLVTSGDVIAVDMAQLEASKYRTSPIPTTTTPVARATEADALSFAWTGLNQTEGSLYCEVQYGASGANLGQMGILSTHSSTYYNLYQNSTVWAYSYDGTNLTSLSQNPSAFTTYKMATRWSTATGKQQVIIGGVSSAEATYDGAFNYDNTLSSYKAASGATAPLRIKNIRIYNKDRGQAYLQGVTK